MLTMSTLRGTGGTCGGFSLGGEGWWSGADLRLDSNRDWKPSGVSLGRRVLVSCVALREGARDCSLWAPRLRPPLLSPLLPLMTEKVSRVGVRRSKADFDPVRGKGGGWYMLEKRSLQLGLAVMTESKVSSLPPERMLGAMGLDLDLLGVVGVFPAFFLLGRGAVWYMDGGLGFLRRLSFLVFPLELDDDLIDGASHTRFISNTVQPANPVVARDTERERQHQKERKKKGENVAYPYCR